jgi:uncharacterized protein (DUF1684 family)
MLAALFASVVLASPPNPDDLAYVKKVEAWRQDQDRDLRTAEGWLSVVGLSWLQEGKNSVGSSKSARVKLPSSAPSEFGNIDFTNGDPILRIAPKSTFTVPGGLNPLETQNGETVIHLQPDSTGRPTKIVTGSITFEVIKRGARTGVRVWDSKSRELADFKGCKWYPVDPSYRIEAEFVPYAGSKSIPIKNILGDIAPAPTPGYVKFTIGGKSCQLQAISAGSSLFFNFHDLTSGVDTYPAGRFLDAPAPKDGKVILDFNQATNPSCAFTAFATCPLPPAANFLDVAIPAGEKTHHPRE